MRPSKFTEDEIVGALRQVRDGTPAVQICRQLGITETTFYRWRKTYRGMSLQEVQRLKELEKENARLKRMLAERLLEIDLLKEVVAKKP